jgi:hypothetical protein
MFLAIFLHTPNVIVSFIILTLPLVVKGFFEKKSALNIFFKNSKKEV